MRRNDFSAPVGVAIDFETSGYAKYSACALGMAKIEDGAVADQFYTLIRPPSSRIAFTHVHGLTWQDLKNAPAFDEIWPSALKFMEDAAFLLAHNASFDCGVLNACCAYFAVERPNLPFLCTLRGARKALKLRRNSLSDVCNHFNIPLNHHHAGSDAQGCALIFIELAKLGLSSREMMLYGK